MSIDERMLHANTLSELAAARQEIAELKEQLEQRKSTNAGWNAYYSLRDQQSALIAAKDAEITSLKLQISAHELAAGMPLTAKINGLDPLEFVQLLYKKDAEIAELKEQRNIAVSMLAGWCVAVDKNGTGWDDWDEYYKDAMYRDNPIRELLNVEIAEQEKIYGKS